MEIDLQRDSAKSFSQTGGEKSIKDLISKLRFISKIKPEEKINVKSLFVRDNTEVYQRILRTLRNISQEDGESKEATMAFLEAVTDTAINLICVYKADPNNEFNNHIANLIITNLEESFTGMESLIKTYSYDRIYTAQIEAMMGTLTLRLETLKSERGKAE